MEIPIMVTIMYIVMPICHVLLFRAGLKYIPWPPEQDETGGGAG